MNAPRASETHGHTFAEVRPEALSPERLGIADLKKIRLSISADLGRTNMLVRDVLALKQGFVVTLDKLAGEMTDIYVNGVPLARGEIVVIGDTLHVRIGEIMGVPTEARESGADET